MKKTGSKRKYSAIAKVAKIGPRLPGGYFKSKSPLRRNIQLYVSKGERKYVDSFRTAINVATAPTGSECDDTTMLCLNGVAQGTTQSTRLGNKIIMKSVQVNGILSLDVLQDSSDAGESSYVRVFLVLDRQTNGAQLNGEDVYSDGGGSDICSLRNLEFSDRFLVLAEEACTLDYTNSQTDGANTASVAGTKKYFTMFKNLNIPCQYKTNTATVTSVNDNSLHILAFADNGGVNLSWQSRVRYTDK